MDSGGIKLAVYYYISESKDGWLNLAVDNFFIHNLSKNDILLYFYINKNAVIIGKSQNAWRECNLDAMERDKTQLVRRHTGGGAVFHDENNLNFSFVMSEKNYDLARQLDVVCRVITKLGLEPEISGRNDILIDGKKFSGNAFASIRNMISHHGTLLINTDLNRLSNYLNVSEKKMNAKGIKSVKSRVCNLCDFDPSITVSQVLNIFRQEFAKEYGEAEEYKFNDGELAEVDKLYKEQMSWEWKLGRTPSFDYAIEERFSFGEIQILFDVREGRIIDVTVYTDALDTEIVSSVKDVLIGVKFSPIDIAQALYTDKQKTEFIEMADYIKTISF